MRVRLGTRLEARLQGRLKLAKLLEMPEEDFAELARKLETDPAFARLREAGALVLTPFPRAYFTARRFAGRQLAPPSTALGELLDGDSELVGLIRRVGAERFEECFLKGESSHAERARRCGIALEDARRLGEFLDRLYIRAESEPRAEAPVQVYSSVAGIRLRGKTPELAFFNRDIWKGRYRLDPERLQAHLSSLDPAARTRTEGFVRRLEFADQRKSTLLAALEALIHAQADYLRTGDPARRQPLTQRSLAAALGVDPSVVNRLIGNKCVELPWGVEAPLKALLPSGKTLAKEKLHELAARNPGLPDSALARELAARHQIRLSRRSIAQYRKELGLPARSAKPGGPG